MIRLGTPSDLMKRYCCVIAYVYDGYEYIGFKHAFCMATDEETAYYSTEMRALEDSLLAEDYTLSNSYVLEVV